MTSSGLVWPRTFHRLIQSGFGKAVYTRSAGCGLRRVIQHKLLSILNPKVPRVLHGKTQGLGGQKAETLRG